MSRRLLLIDSTYLCHRAKHSTGGLTYGDVPTGVAFGFLRDLEKQIEILSPDICVFAFDYGGPGLRSKIDPGYKISRVEKALTDEEFEEKKVFIQEIRALYSEILPDMGYKNLFRVRGYEGDDIIAKVAEDLSEDDEGVIYTGDEDMWQCLRPNVVWKNPKGKAVTFQSFVEEWGILPVQWADVKALAGCATDDVKGVDGVGPKTAVQWIKGLLKPTSKKYQKISEEIGVMAKNLPLVRLPFEGTPTFNLVDDECSEKKKEEVHSRLGIRSKRAKSRLARFDV